MRVVVCDTGPILHLREADALDLLAIIGEVIIPPAVDDELATRISNWPASRPTWLRRMQLSEGDALQAEQWMASAGLALGEAQAIALARSLPADFSANR